MQRDQESFRQESRRFALTGFGTRAWRLILDGIAARAHAVAGGRPASRPATVGLVVEE